MRVCGCVANNCGFVYFGVVLVITETNLLISINAGSIKSLHKEDKEAQITQGVKIRSITLRTTMLSTWA